MRNFVAMTGCPEIVRHFLDATACSVGRLYRPTIPLSVRCEVAERQLRARGLELDEKLFFPKNLTERLQWLRESLALVLGCDVKELRLDHDPPLGARPRRRCGLGRKTYYTPDANDPDYLFYRPHGPEHEGSHLVKTNVRGDHGQHPDRVLIKKERRRERSRNGETRRKTSKFPKRASGLKRITGFGRPKVKHRWPKRPLGRRKT